MKSKDVLMDIVKEIGEIFEKHDLTNCEAFRITSYLMVVAYQRDLNDVMPEANPVCKNY